MTTLTSDEWEQTYQPVRNHLNPDEDWNGWYFETYGEEEEWVAEQPNENVWTILETEDGLVIVNGWFRVNRFGYIVCENPWTPGEYWQVEC
jgi:hypothetical protein